MRSGSCERDPQDAGWWIAIVERERADGCEHALVVAKNAAKMFALVFREAASPLSNDVGQFGFHFL